MSADLHWRDPAAALRDLAESAPPGLRPLMLQAADAIERNEKYIAGLEKAWVIARDTLSAFVLGGSRPEPWYEQVKEHIERLTRDVQHHKSLAWADQQTPILWKDRAEFYEKELERLKGAPGSAAREEIDHLEAGVSACQEEIHRLRVALERLDQAVRRTNRSRGRAFRDLCASQPT